jgi:Uncharacterized protein conserved in bacteria (DUF2252)
MLMSPFAFLRGSSVIMANDLARTLDSGWRVQACGDAHWFDEAVSALAAAYADQVTRDHEALVRAAESGRVTATPQA